jgi:hypothetical protein
VAVATRRYLDWFVALSRCVLSFLTHYRNVVTEFKHLCNRYVALFLWCLTIWVSFAPLVYSKQDSTVSRNNLKIIQLIQKLLVASFICAGILLFEKFAIQWIASKFHELSYEGRISDQKFAVKVLVILYRNSSDIPERSDTLGDAQVSKTQELGASRIFEQALKGVRLAARTTTTVFGNVASEIAGTSVLQPNSPSAIVQVKCYISTS